MEIVNGNYTRVTSIAIWWDAQIGAKCTNAVGGCLVSPCGTLCDFLCVSFSVLLAVHPKLTPFRRRLSTALRMFFPLAGGCTLWWGCSSLWLEGEVCRGAALPSGWRVKSVVGGAFGFRALPLSNQ